MKVIDISKDSSFIKCNLCGKLLIYNNEDIITSHETAEYNNWKYEYVWTYKVRCPCCENLINIKREFI